MPARPSGEPMAITGSPGRRLLDVPSLITVRLVALTFTTARSVMGSRPTMVAGTRAPLLNTAVMLSALPPVGATTWLLVRM